MLLEANRRRALQRPSGRPISPDPRSAAGSRPSSRLSVSNGSVPRPPSQLGVRKAEAEAEAEATADLQHPV